ncbi:hypothetical protein [Streptomyces sp. NPDC051214]|uniref:hypothetical protein n=1 Tax=Streptomyces sp. NPDC051214 TaxID=3155282 RepID=UPI00341ECDB4
MPFVLCSDFTIFPDDLQLGPMFTLSGMDFQDAPSSKFTSFVNRTAGLNGLQFGDVGLEVTLPTVVPWARMHVGQFNTAFTIEAIDPNGTTVHTYSANKPNSYYFANFPKGDIASFRFTGGGNEGVIVSLCVFVP